MNWYYAEAGTQQGPVTEEQFNELVRAGRITDDTLVWHEGVADWAQYRFLKPPADAPSGTPFVPPQAPGAVCASCGGTFSINTMFRHGPGFICANCQPAFTQKLAAAQSGGPLVPLSYAGFWIRLVAKFVDGLILGLVIGIPVFVFVFLFALGSASNRPPETVAALLSQMAILLAELAFFVLRIAYNTLFVGKFGATPGKMVCQLKVVDADGSPVRYGRAFGRACAELLSGLTCDIGYIIAGFDDQKRALHDHICSTRVVYKES